jgi:hypothetical protein
MKQIASRFLTASTLMMKAIYSSGTLLTFIGLHGVISQKVDLLMVELLYSDPFGYGRNSNWYVLLRT